MLYLKGECPCEEAYDEKPSKWEFCRDKLKTIIKVEQTRRGTMDVWVAFRGTSNEVEAWNGRVQSGAEMSKACWSLSSLFQPQIGMCHAVSSCIEEIDMGEYIQKWVPCFSAT